MVEAASQARHSLALSLPACGPCRSLDACACACACARCRSMDAFLRLRDSISSGQLGAIACLDMAVDLGRQAAG